MAPILQDDIMSTPPPESDRINFLSSQYDKVKSVSVPEGLEVLMNNLTVHILKAQPQNIHLFAAQHFEKLLYLREKLDEELSEQTGDNSSNIGYVVEDNQLTYRTPKFAATDFDKKKNLALVFTSLLSADILFNKSIDNSSNASETSRSKRSANEHLQQIEEINESPTENAEEIEEKRNEDIDGDYNQATEQTMEANNVAEINGVESEKSDDIENEPDISDLKMESEQNVDETDTDETDKKSVDKTPTEDTDKEDEKTIEEESVMQNELESERSEEPQSLSEPVTIVESDQVPESEEPQSFSESVTVKPEQVPESEEPQTLSEPITGVESQQVPESESSGETQNLESETLENSQEGDKSQESENVGKEILDSLESDKPQEMNVEESIIQVSQSLTESEPHEEIQSTQSQNLIEVSLSDETKILSESQTGNDLEDEVRQNIEAEKIDEETQDLTESPEKVQSENGEPDETQNNDVPESEKIEDTQKVITEENIDESQNTGESGSENSEDPQNVAETKEKLENESEKVDESKNTGEKESQNGADQQNVSETDEENGKVNELQSTADSENIDASQNAIETEENLGDVSEKVDESENTTDPDAVNGLEPQNVTETEQKLETENNSEKIEELQSKIEPDNDKATTEKLESEKDSQKINAQSIAGLDSDKQEQMENETESVNNVQNHAASNSENIVEAHNDTVTEEKLEAQSELDSVNDKESQNETKPEESFERENEHKEIDVSQNIPEPDIEKELENISQTDLHDIANANEPETIVENGNSDQIQNTSESKVVQDTENLENIDLSGKSMDTTVENNESQSKSESDKNEELNKLTDGPVSGANVSETLSNNPDNTETLTNMNSEDSDDDNKTEEIIGNITKEASVENESGVLFTENSDANISNKEDENIDKNICNETESEKPKFFVGDIDNVIEISSDLQTQLQDSTDNAIHESEINENSNSEAISEHASEILEEKVLVPEMKDTPAFEEIEKNNKETSDLELDSNQNDSIIQNESETLTEAIAKQLESENMEKQGDVIEINSDKPGEISDETPVLADVISENILDIEESAENDSSKPGTIGNDPIDQSENITNTLKNYEKMEDEKQAGIMEETSVDSESIKETNKSTEIVNEGLKGATEADVQSSGTSQESKTSEESEDNSEKPGEILNNIVVDDGKIEVISEKTDDFESKENNLKQSEQVVNEEAEIVDKKGIISEEAVKESESIEQTKKDLEKSKDVEVITPVEESFEEVSKDTETLKISENIDNAVSDDIIKNDEPFEEKIISEKIENDSEKIEEVTDEVKVSDANVEITSQDTSEDLANINELENDSEKFEKSTEEDINKLIDENSIETSNNVLSESENVSSIIAEEEGNENNEKLTSTPEVHVDKLQSSKDDKDKKEAVNVENNKEIENTNINEQENTVDNEQTGKEAAIVENNEQLEKTNIKEQENTEDNEQTGIDSNIFESKPKETSIDSQIISNLDSHDRNLNSETVEDENSEQQILPKLDSDNIKQSEILPVVEKECVQVILPPKTFQDNAENREVANNITGNDVSEIKENEETKEKLDKNPSTESEDNANKLVDIEINEENKPLEENYNIIVTDKSEETQDIDQSINEKAKSLETKDEVPQQIVSDAIDDGEKTKMESIKNQSLENLDIKDANESLANKNEALEVEDLNAKSNEPKDIDSDDDTVVLGTLNLSKEDEDTNKNKNDETSTESNSQTTENPQGMQFFLGEDNEKQNSKSIQEIENEIFQMELDETKNDTQNVDVSSQKSISGLVYEDNQELDLDDSGFQPDSLEIDSQNHFPNESINVIHNENDLNNNEIDKIAIKIENYDDEKQSRNNTSADTITIDGDYESLESIPEPEILAKISIGSTYPYDDLDDDENEPSGMSSLTTHIRNINTAVLIIQSAWRKYLKRRNEKKIHSPMMSNNKEQLLTTSLLNVNVESNNNVSSTNSTVEPLTNSSTKIHSNNNVTTAVVSDTTTTLTVSNDLISSLNSNNNNNIQDHHHIVDNINENFNDLDTNDADVLNSNEKNSLENLAINNKIETTYSADTMKLLRQKRPSTAEMNLNKTKETDAAIKIQAGFRGYKARKQIKTQLKQQINDTTNKTGTEIENKAKKLDNVKENINQDENIVKKAATTIQANIRGFLTRKKIKSTQEK